MAKSSKHVVAKPVVQINCYPSAISQLNMKFICVAFNTLGVRATSEQIIEQTIINVTMYANVLAGKTAHDQMQITLACELAFI